jgi:hypothetical protein
LDISLTLFGEKARQVEKHLGLDLVGDQTDINTKVLFRKGPAGKLEITLEAA